MEHHNTIFGGNNIKVKVFSVFKGFNNKFHKFYFFGKNRKVNLFLTPIKEALLFSFIIYNIP